MGGGRGGGALLIRFFVFCFVSPVTKVNQARKAVDEKRKPVVLWFLAFCLSFGLSLLTAYFG